MRTLLVSMALHLSNKLSQIVYNTENSIENGPNGMCISDMHGKLSLCFRVPIHHAPNTIFRCIYIVHRTCHDLRKSFIRSPGRHLCFNSLSSKEQKQITPPPPLYACLDEGKVRNANDYHKGRLIVLINIIRVSNLVMISI